MNPASNSEIIKYPIRASLMKISFMIAKILILVTFFGGIIVSAIFFTSGDYHNAIVTGIASIFIPTIIFTTVVVFGMLLTPLEKD